MGLDVAVCHVCFRSFRLFFVEGGFVSVTCFVVFVSFLFSCFVVVLLLLEFNDGYHPVLRRR